MFFCVCGLSPLFTMTSLVGLSISEALFFVSVRVFLTSALIEGTSHVSGLEFLCEGWWS